MDDKWGGDVRAEMTSLDIEADCPTSITLSLHTDQTLLNSITLSVHGEQTLPNEQKMQKTQKSRRNKHQTSSLRNKKARMQRGWWDSLSMQKREKSLPVQRKLDFLPLQKCQQAGPFSKNDESLSMTHGVDFNDNKSKNDVTDKGKEKKSGQNLKMAKESSAIIRAVIACEDTSSPKAMVGSDNLAIGTEMWSGQAFIGKGASSSLESSVHDKDMPEEISLSKSEMESLSTEKCLLHMEVRGPPTDSFEVDARTKDQASKKEGEVRGNPNYAVSIIGKTKEASGKKAKEERNRLSAKTTGINAKNNRPVDTKNISAKDNNINPPEGEIDRESKDDTNLGAQLIKTQAQVKMPNAKTQTTNTMRTQQAKWELLNKDPVVEKSDVEKETTDTTETTTEGNNGGNGTAQIQVLWMKTTESEQRLKQINQDGVVCYNDNRLIEEREKDETISKQRLDPMSHEQLEKTDTMPEKLTIGLRANQKASDDKLKTSTISNELSKDAAHSNSSVSSDTSLQQDSTDNLRPSLLDPSEKFGTSPRQMTENTATSSDNWTDYSSGSNEPTEGSWNEMSCSFESGKYMDVPVMSEQPAFRHELYRLPMFTKASHQEMNVGAITSPQMMEKCVNHLPEFEFGNYHFSDSNVVSLMVKTLKVQINHMSQGKISTDLLKMDKSVKVKTAENDEDDESDNFEEKYKDEETEKESINSIINETETGSKNKAGYEHTEKEEVEGAPSVDDGFGKKEEAEVDDDDDICSSLRIYSLTRKQEVEEMRRALDHFDVEIRAYSSKLEVGLEKLKRLESLLSRPGLKDQGSSNHEEHHSRHTMKTEIYACKPWVEEPFKRLAKLQPTCGCMKGRPPNPPRKPRIRHGFLRHNDIYMPEKGQSRRSLDQFRGHNFGRKCSGSGRGGGSYSRETGGGSSKEHGKMGDSGGNHDDGPGGSDSNNSNSNGGGSGSGGYPWRPGPRSLGDTEVPPFDPKKYRKKHIKMDTTSCSEFLGALKLKTQTGPRWQNLLEDQSAAWCVSTCLSSPDELSDEMMSCLVCVSLNSLLKHYADCNAIYSACDMCTQIFSVICAHVSDCMNNNRGESEEGDCNIELCVNIVRLMEGREIEVHVRSLWFHVRKKLARIIGTCEVDNNLAQDPVLVGMATGPGADQESTSTRINSGSHLTSMGARMPSIPEEGVAPSVPSPSSSRVLTRKRSALSKVPEVTEASAEPDKAKKEREEKQAQSLPAITTGVETVYTRGETTGDEGDHGTGTNSTEESSSGGGPSGDRPDNASRHTSLPMGRRPGYLPNYYPSITFSPMGIKGIGEVVYGNRARMVEVADYWLSLKRTYREAGKLSRQYREEGVILNEFKSNLKIQGLRYNQQFQWVKLNPLGNGMSGKCHLAEDFETEFKFCVKEIHISNYEKEEIELWSELEHPNIVKIYGAIRFREDIYILQEFIEGGSLTEAINTQKLLGRRLSQVTALAYFRQLLQVLVHLKAKHILHEDLKADNILLKQKKGVVSIKVADFGLARRCPDRIRGRTSPVGTQTQWSPEKSDCTGYGFPAEVWAAVCVLVHILSGYPPWIKRFEHALKSLMFVIVKQSPPIEDIPRNIDAQLRDLIERGFTVSQNTRPSAAQLLLHPAFRLLEEPRKSTSIFYSNLPSTNHPSLNLSDNPNADLLEIIENLNKEIPSPLEPPTTYTVYPVLNAPQNGDQMHDGASAPLSSSVSGSQKGASQSASQNGVLPTHIGTPPVEVGGPPDHFGASQRQNHVNGGDRPHVLDPSAMELLWRFNEEYNTGAAGAQGGLTVDRNVVDQYLYDHDPPGPQHRPVPRIERSSMTIYDPDSLQFAAQQGQDNKTQANITQDGKTPSNYHQPSSFNVSSVEETIMKEVLPDFAKLGIDDYSNVDDDEEEEEDEDIFEGFVLEKAIPKIIKSFSQPELSGEGFDSTNTSRREKSEGSFVVVIDEVYNTIQDDDELFMSGPKDEKAESTGSSHLKRVSLTKDSGSRGMFVHDPKSDQSQSRSASSSSSTIDQRYSLAPYLVPPDNPPHHSTPKKVVPQSTPSPEAGPGDAKRLRFDTSTPTSSPIPRRTDHVDQKREIQEGNDGARNPHAVLSRKENYQQQSPSSLRPIDLGQGNNPTASHQLSPAVHVPISQPLNPRFYNAGHRSPAVEDGRINQGVTGRSRKAVFDDLNQRRKKNMSPHAGTGAQAVGPKLVLDVDKAQQGAATPVTYAQTAPVLSPPRDQPGLKRMQSEHSAPSLSTLAHNTSQTLHKTPSTSTSQYDQQENAFRELELAMSEHSDPSYLLNNDLDDEEPHGEIEIDIENPAHSISHYLTQSPSDKIEVTFRNQHRHKEIKIRFPIKSKSLTWEKILDEEFSRHTELYANFAPRICLTFEDGNQLDLQECLGEANVTVLVEEAVGEERWWMENGVLMNIHARQNEL